MSIYFILETNTIVLIAELNKAVTDLPSSLLTYYYM
jgi:hypothetical protein